jgi:hypothetical protein
MALIFLDGFDKYGDTNSNAATMTTLMAGEWTTITNANIAAGLSVTGQAVTAGASGLTLTKTITAAGRIIGGVRFRATLATAVGIQFLDGASNQCGIGIATTGTISLRNGAYSSGTILGSSASPISANTTHYLEWDITFANSAAYNVYLDGVSIISGTGDTTATANNTISGVSLQSGVGAGVVTFDDFYLFDTSGSINNAVLLTSPRIETTLPTSDSAVQFSIGASVLGGTMSRNSTSFSTTANQFYVRPFTPARACTLNSITVIANATSAAVNLRPIVYSDSSGAPGTLLTGGATVTGLTSGSQTNMPVTTPQSLSAGTQYWLGYMADIAVTNGMALYDSSAAGRTGTSTFSTGAPSSPPTLTTGQATVMLWGNVTLASAANYYEVNQQPPPAANMSYVGDGTVSDEDLYTFPNLSAIPASIYAVAVKAFCARSDSGARTVSLRVKSSSTDGGGSSTGQTPGTSYGWIGSNFETDPNGSIAWTGVNLNAATTGFKIDA